MRPKSNSVLQNIVKCGNLFKKNVDSRKYSTMHSVHEYIAPEWARQLKNIPKQKMQLANIPTPIHEWRLPGIPENFHVSIKRDDMTGSTLSGNKVRKLEFLMADCLTQGCKHVITCGGLQSNHCRAVATCARELGLQPHLVLRTDIEDPSSVSCEGNLLLDRLCAAKIYLSPRHSPYLTHLKPRMDKLAENIGAETGERCYKIPVGGSNSLGLWGYINMFSELVTQGAVEQFDDLIFATGSGSTAGGLAIGNYLTGSKLRIHGISVSDDARYFHAHCQEMLDAVGLHVRAEDILDVIDGHKGLGYGISTQEELDYILSVASSTGIMLDPVYTGKAAIGLQRELNNNPDMFKGNRILFVHTGGVFGLYDGRINDTLKVVCLDSTMAESTIL
ncbi:DCYD1-like protein [Mya arenaria]|uniref:DCYD1-like protein n=1 Tax=Mya arenaria TaxID=6604 RepID=A0ABY7DS75_MYAAR|nr:DCYD1-like protein [Mya arenaria]